MVILCNMFDLRVINYIVLRATQPLYNIYSVWNKRDSYILIVLLIYDVCDKKLINKVIDSTNITILIFGYLWLSVMSLETEQENFELLCSNELQTNVMDNIYTYESLCGGRKESILKMKQDPTNLQKYQAAIELLTNYCLKINKSVFFTSIGSFVCTLLFVINSYMNNPSFNIVESLCLLVVFSLSYGLVYHINYSYKKYLLAIFPRPTSIDSGLKTLVRLENEFLTSNREVYCCCMILFCSTFVLTIVFCLSYYIHFGFGIINFAILMPLTMLFLIPILSIKYSRPLICKK